MKNTSFNAFISATNPKGVRMYKRIKGTFKYNENNGLIQSQSLKYWSYCAACDKLRCNLNTSTAISSIKVHICIRLRLRPYSLTGEDVVAYMHVTRNQYRTDIFASCTCIIKLLCSLFLNFSLIDSTYVTD
jgi:hypothetical protein